MLSKRVQVVFGFFVPLEKRFKDCQPPWSPSTSPVSSSRMIVAAPRLGVLAVARAFMAS